MNKFSCIIKKGKLWSIILGFILAAGLIIGSFFGLNTVLDMNNSETLTITVDKYTYTEKVSEIEKDCEAVFGEKNVKYSYKMEGETSGVDTEIVYVFAEGTNLTEVKSALKETFNAKTSAEGAWAGSFINVMSATETAKSVITNGYALRGAIAAVVMAALAFAYVTIRYRWDMGVLAGGTTLLAMFLATALVAILRLPVTASVAYVVLASGILATIMLMFTLSNFRDNKVETTEDAIAENVAFKEVVTLSVLSAGILVALVIAGLIANVSLCWFGLTSIVGVISATAIGLVFAPSVYLPLKAIADNKAAEKDNRYKGAKKNSEE